MQSKKKYSHKIALLGTHGLPARHGAFEQTIHKLCEYAEEKQLDVYLLVGCSAESMALPYNSPVAHRIFARRGKGIGIILYDLVSSVKAYFLGARTFVYFGYEFAPFFLFFRLLGVKIICNVDGIEWRRAKWGRAPRYYFRLCEWICARTASNLIFDAHGIARYFGINLRAAGDLVFYGSDPLPQRDKEPEFPPGTYYSLVMRMEPENNIKVIIEGFMKASVDRPLLLIGPSTGFFEKECKHMIDGKNVRYLGPIYDRERLINIRKHCYAYVHGHSVGGTNPTLIEAIGLNNRIIAFNSIFNREVCENNARYFSNAQDLAEILKTNDLQKPPTLDERYGWNYVAQKYFEICGIDIQENCIET